MNTLPNNKIVSRVCHFRQNVPPTSVRDSEISSQTAFGAVWRKKKERAALSEDLHLCLWGMYLISRSSWIRLKERNNEKNIFTYSLNKWYLLITKKYPVIIWWPSIKLSGTTVWLHYTVSCPLVQFQNKVFLVQNVPFGLNRLPFPRMITWGYLSSKVSKFFNLWQRDYN